MDELDFRYKLSVAWNKTAKFMSADSHTWLDRSILFPMAGLVCITFLATDSDELTTAQSETIQQELSKQISDLVVLQEQGNFTKDDGNNFVAALLAEEDISEQQVQSLIYEYGKGLGYLSDTTKYTQLGSIGDLRECRTALGGGEDTDALIACMVDEGADEKLGTHLVMILALLTMPLALIGKMPAFRREADRKPRHPKFKH